VRQAIAAAPVVDLAAANAWAGHDKQAKDAVARLRKARPGFTMQRIRPEDQITDNPEFKAQFARIVEGLHKAGLPDEPTSAAGRFARAEALNDARAWDLALKESRRSSPMIPTTPRHTRALIITRCFSAAVRKGSPTSKGRFG